MELTVSQMGKYETEKIQIGITSLGNISSILFQSLSYHNINNNEELILSHHNGIKSPNYSSDNDEKDLIHHMYHSDKEEPHHGHNYITTSPQKESSPSPSRGWNVCTVILNPTENSLSLPIFQMH